MRGGREMKFDISERLAFVVLLCACIARGYREHAINEAVKCMKFLPGEGK